jgi:prepilin-type N-terminal cleavage/methylation domain-containing protein
MNTQRKSQAGMTLIEMLVALTVFSVVIAGAFGFLRGQSKGFNQGSERAGSLQNALYTANSLELDLRTLGSDVPDGQPFIIYAAGSVLAYNADYTTNVDNDPYAVYYDPDAPDNVVTALKKSQRITIPTTGVSYPDTNYTMGGAAGLNSPAETIVYFFLPDSTTSRTDDYILFRQVNQQTPELVARNLLKTSSQDFFRYFRRKSPLDAPAYVDTVPSASLPMRHSVAWHGSPADTGASGRVDSLRGVELNFTVTNGKSGKDERKLTLKRTIRFPNAGLAVRRTCGDAPQLGVGLAVADTVIGGSTAVRLLWSPATDEAGGEKDVETYVIWRRVVGDPDWGTPYLSMPAGQASYVYVDADVTSGTNYQYALAAQDCTPLASALAQSAAILVP